VQIRCLLAALLLAATPTLHADDVPDIDTRVERGRALLMQVAEHASDLVLAQSQGDADAAIANLERSRDQGIANAAHELGFVYLSGRFGITPDIDEAARNYELAIGQELPVALADYGLMLYRGRHFPADPERGLVLLNRAAELGSLHAIAFLMDLLRTSGEAQDRVKADAWFASLGMRDDELALGVDGDPLDRALDHAYGQASIYITLREGVILEDDPELAASWLQRIDPEHAPAVLDGLASLLSQAIRVRSVQRLALSLQEVAFACPNPSPTIIVSFAGLLSTARSAELRDGARAVQLMDALLNDVEAASFMIDTMAAAYAEAGDFAAAISTQEKANELFAAESRNLDIGLDHHAAYLEGRAWRE
jgi:hypothetical protein